MLRSCFLDLLHRPFPNLSSQVMAITDIPAKSEVSKLFIQSAVLIFLQKLFTSYVDTTMPTFQRQKDLEETYKFTCKCNICTPTDRSPLRDWREMVWCPKDCGGVYPVPSEGTSFCEDSS